jgi:O-antigen/teichoic acid export membrane protein
VLFQGVYLLTSIGLNITKRTEYYPLATSAAAATSVVANLLLIPRYGVMGAAWSSTLSYAVLAAAAMGFSQRVYPMRYEWSRVGLVIVAGAATAIAARTLVPESLAALPGLLLRGTLVALGYPLLLLAAGFFRPGERERLHALATRLLGRARRTPLPRWQSDGATPVTSTLDTAVAGGSPLSAEDER